MSYEFSVLYSCYMFWYSNCRLIIVIITNTQPGNHLNRHFLVLVALLMTDIAVVFTSVKKVMFSLVFVH